MVELTLWNAVIGIRSRIVNEYKNIDMNAIFELVKTQCYQFIVEFLMQSIEIAGES